MRGCRAPQLSGATGSATECDTPTGGRGVTSPIPQTTSSRSSGVTNLTQHAIAPPSAALGVAGAPAASVMLSTLAVAAVTVLNLAVSATARYFPYQDTTNHLARYLLIDRYISGLAPSWVHVRALPTAYVAVDALGAALVHVTSARATEGLLAGLTLLALPLGLYALLSAVAPAQRGWAVVGALLSLNWFFLIGFLNYCLGLGLAMMWLALWWPRRSTRAWSTRIALAAAAGALLFVHMTTAALLVVVAVECALAVADARTRRGENESGLRAAFRDARVPTAIVIVLGVGVAWALTRLGPHTSGGAAPVTEFRTIPMKIKELAAPFYAFSTTQMIVLLGGYLTSLAVFLGLTRPDVRNVWILSSVALLLLYVASPYAAIGVADVDVRWILFACLLPFCATGSRGPVAPKRWLFLPVIAGVANAALVASTAHSIDHDLHDFRDALSSLPPGLRILPIVSDGDRYGRVTPYRHFALWYVIDGSGRDGELFAGSRLNDQFRHFQVDDSPYATGTHWGTRDFDPLDWSRIRDGIDIVIQAGSNARVRDILLAHVHERARFGEITLYDVPQTRHPAR
jgi:hypothetical protein